MSLIGHSTATGGKEKYRPAYLDHFEKKQEEEKARMSSHTQPVPSKPVPPQQPQPQQQHQQPPPKQVTPPHHFQRSFIEGDFAFVSMKIAIVSAVALRVLSIFVLLLAANYWMPPIYLLHGGYMC